MQIGGQPFVLCPELYDEKVTTRKTGTILCLRSGYKINSFLAIETLPVFLVVVFSAPACPYRASQFWAVLGGDENWKRIFEKNTLGFGRTELSSRLS